jgi:putative adenylate-forming enzyme
MNSAKLEKYQLKKAQTIVKYAHRRSQFFQRHFAEADLSDVWNLPLTTKKLMMDNLSNYNTVGFEKKELIDFCLEVERAQSYDKRFKNYNVAMSSGTSGNKGIVITSPSEEKYLRAAFFARFSFPKVLKLNIAFILRVTTPAFDMNKFGQRMTHISQLNSIEEIVKQLQDLQPNVLSAPPSMLQILAKEMREGRLIINPLRVVSYAEVLYPDIRSEIERIFDTPVHEIYQASEGSIAMTCSKGSLHINEDLVFVQTLDSEGNHAVPGEPCYKMVVTDLHKKSQPIIRFELNDIITVSSEKCSCGSSFRVIERIMGRTDDLFWAHNSETDELQFIFPDYISRAIISSSEEIEEYQAIQKSFTKVLVRVVPTATANNEEIVRAIQKAIRNVFLSYRCNIPNVKVVFQSALASKDSHKLIRIHRDFKI